MSNFKEKSAELYKQGYSCSESIVRAAYECKIINSNLDIALLTKIASPFSGGMLSGCLCGAIAGAQITIGTVLGREKLEDSSNHVKLTAKSFIDKFKEKRKVTCCRALSAGYDFHSPERRQNCIGIVKDIAEILENHIKENLHATDNV